MKHKEVYSAYILEVQGLHRVISSDDPMRNGRQCDSMKEQAMASCTGSRDWTRCVWGSTLVSFMATLFREIQKSPELLRARILWLEWPNGCPLRHLLLKIPLLPAAPPQASCLFPLNPWMTLSPAITWQKHVQRAGQESWRWRGLSKKHLNELTALAQDVDIVVSQIIACHRAFTSEDAVMWTGGLPDRYQLASVS